MQLDLTAIITAFIIAAIGGSSGGFLLALRRLRSENRHQLAQSIQAANEAVAERWKELVEAHRVEIDRTRRRQDCLEAEVEKLREKLRKAEEQLERTRLELLKTQTALEAEKARKTILEEALTRIEHERDVSEEKRSEMADRIAELERKGHA
jgi:chromosome segregation ATPase